jgi:hypothetical protein
MNAKNSANFAFIALGFSIACLGAALCLLAFH